MKTKTFYTHHGPTLPVVLREIVAGLNADDWVRCDTTAGIYYVVGMGAHAAEQAGTADFLGQSIPSGKPVSVVGEQQVHARVASSKSAGYYLRQATARLVESGIESSQIDRFVERIDKGDHQGALDGWTIYLPGTDRFGAFINLLHALAVRRGAEVETLVADAERDREFANALQKVQLNQLASQFEGIVKRAGSLDTLTFDDTQLNEASRCYLYGFFRATVLLSASALEKCLKDAVGLTDRDFVEYSPLVEKALQADILGRRERVGVEPECAVYSRDIFSKRNQVAHRGLEPQSEMAAELLFKAREVIEFVRGNEARRRGDGPGA